MTDFRLRKQNASHDSVAGLLMMAMRFARDPLPGKFARLCQSICVEFDCEGCAIRYLPESPKCKALTFSFCKANIGKVTRANLLFSYRIKHSEFSRRLNLYSDGGPAVVAHAQSGQLVLWRSNAFNCFTIQQANQIGELWQACMSDNDIYYKPKNALEQEDYALTPRLRQVLSYLIQGFAEKQIAEQLHISRHTVHIYVKSIYRRFAVCSRSELLIKCLKPNEKDNFTRESVDARRNVASRIQFPQSQVEPSNQAVPPAIPISAVPRSLTDVLLG